MPAIPENLSFPSLLRAVRARYVRTIRVVLLREGFVDLPRDGAYLLRAIENEGTSLSDIVGSLTISKQSATQLVNSMVHRGYIERRVDPDDRRRARLAPTPRGILATGAVRLAIDQVDREIDELVGSSAVAAVRSTLMKIVADEKEKRP